MPRRATRELSSGFVQSAVARGGKAADYSDALCRGLTLRVYPSGSRVWFYRYRNIEGRSLQARLGDFPALGLSKAREAAFTMRAKVGAGADPQREKRARQTEEKSRKVKTVSDLIDDYLAWAARRNRASTIKLNTQRLNTHVRPKLGALRVEHIRKADVRAIVNDLEAAGHAVTANRVVTLIGALFRHARRELDMERVGNPTEGITPFPEKSRERVLADEELRAVWWLLDDLKRCPMAPATAVCIQLAAVTLQRAGEVCGLHDREIDLEQRIWRLPGSRSKNTLPHDVPLSPLAVRLIERARLLRGRRNRPAPLFPSPSDPNRSIGRHAISKAIARLYEALGVEDARTHDLRRTGASLLTSERLGVPRFIVAALLNHAAERGGITGVYDRHSYAAQKRQAAEAWASLLGEIVAGQQVSTSDRVSIEEPRAHA